MGKCRPIPKGHKVRKDGELVKENLLKKLVDREVRIMRHGGKSEEEVKKIKDDRREKAKKAMSKKTGARGLRSILESTLLKTMFDLPGQENIDEVIIDSGATKGTSQPIIVHSKNKSKSDKTSAA